MRYVDFAGVALLQGDRQRALRPSECVTHCAKKVLILEEAKAYIIDAVVRMRDVITPIPHPFLLQCISVRGRKGLDRMLAA